MAENPPPKLDLAALKKQRARMQNSPMPMASDRIFNNATLTVDTTRMQLISPPPEEMLRRSERPPFTPSVLVAERTSPGPNSKRKRQQTPKAVASTSRQSSSQWDAATPNPRVRKQVRRDDIEDVEMESPTRPGYAEPPTTPSRTSQSTASRVLIQSPHYKNPDADYIPSVQLITAHEDDELGELDLGAAMKRKMLAAKSSRRSATPIPPYEPPKDVFTPPREVVVAPPPSTARKAKGRKSIAPGTVQVKQEMPDIDLTVPMPPPSPTDDPLLLSSDIEEIEALPPLRVQKTPKPKKKAAKTPQTATRKNVKSTTKKNPKTPGSSTKTKVLKSTSTAEAAEVVLHEELEDYSPPPRALDYDLPPSSPIPSDDDKENFDWTQGGTTQPMESTEDSMMHVDLADQAVDPVPLLDFDAALRSNDHAAGWSDSEEEEDGKDRDEGEGEYTGRWRLMKVRTKTDPPSEATAERMEEWGRPVSPFPGVRRLFVSTDPPLAQPEMVEEQEQLAPSESDQQEEEEREEEEEVMRLSMEPEPEEEERGEEHVEPVTPAPNGPLDTVSNVSTSEQHVATPAFDFTPRPVDLPFTPVNIQKPHFAFTPGFGTGPRRVLVDEDIQVPLNDTVEGEDGGEEDLSDMEEDFSMVKIVSADPRAAARAAAILKQYDYECFTKKAMKQRKMQRRYSSLDDFSQDRRRKSLLESGIGKAGSSKAKEAERRRRRSTMGVVGDRVVIEGSPCVTLPELLREVEKEVVETLTSPEKKKAGGTPVQRDPFKTPVVLARYQAPELEKSPAWAWKATDIMGERAWTKEEWKILDSCLTDERMEDGGESLRDADDVDVERVVQRFVGMVGGAAVVSRYGEPWSRDSMMQRVRALQKKQRAGNVAPPSTPIAPNNTTTNAALGGEKRLPAMEVPDFTPLGKRAQPPRRSRPSPPLPAPVKENAPFASLARRSVSGVPLLAPYLLAPRYSHLLDEARVVSAEVASMQQDHIQANESEAEEVEEEESMVEAPPAPAPVVLETPRPQGPREPETPATFGKKLKGIFFSYMPTLSKTAPPPSRRLPNNQPGLPLPPPDVLKKNRGPVTTPARPPLPKVKHPKELVELHPAPKVKPGVSGIPRWGKKQQPKRLVELHPVPAPPPAMSGGSTGPLRERRGSGSSVKDLVRGFEEIKRTEEEEAERRRPHSSLGIRRGVQVGGVPGSLMSLGKPTWRP